MHHTNKTQFFVVEVERMWFIGKICGLIRFVSVQLLWPKKIKKNVW